MTLQQPLTRRERNRPACWRELATNTRLVIVTAQSPQPGIVAPLRKMYGAEADADAVRLDITTHENTIAVWRWLAAHRVGLDWIAVVNTDGVKPIDKFRRKLDETLSAADSLAVALHSITVDTADAEPAGLAIATDVVGDLVSTLSLRRPLWPQVLDWSARRGRTVEHVRHLLHPQRETRRPLPRQRPQAQRLR